MYDEEDNEYSIIQNEPVPYLSLGIKHQRTIDSKEADSKPLKRAIYRDNGYTQFERNHIEALYTINMISAQLELTEQTKCMAYKIYKDAKKENLIKGRTIAGMGCACLIYACRQAHISRHLEEFAEYVDEPKKTLYKYYKILVKIFGNPAYIKDLIF